MLDFPKIRLDFSSSYWFLQSRIREPWKPKKVQPWQRQLAAKKGKALNLPEFISPKINRGNAGIVVCKEAFGSIEKRALWWIYICPQLIRRYETDYVRTALRGFWQAEVESIAIPLYVKGREAFGLIMHIFRTAYLDINWQSDEIVLCWDMPISENGKSKLQEVTNRLMADASVEVEYPDLPELSPDQLAKLACEHWMLQQRDRKFVTPEEISSEVLERWCVNYARHQLTDYQYHLSFGERDLMPFVVANRKIEAAYPWLAMECERQIWERRKADLYLLKP